MNKDLIIDSTSSEVSIALLEDKQLVELHSDKKNNPAFTGGVGDIYLGKINKINSGLNAAFVDVGYEKDAFLHYLDLGPQLRSLNKYIQNTLSGKNKEPLLQHFQIEPDIDKAGKISSVLTPGQWMLVQIAKEPISTKGPRITSELAIAGRDMVLIPFSDMVSVSQKIKSADERARLKRLVQSIKPKNFGVIVRTAAEGKNVAELDKDLQDLVNKWKQLFDNLKTARPQQKVLGEMNKTSTLLRDVLNDSFQNIHVNEQSVYEDVKTYIKNIAPGKEDIVKLYKGKIPIFDHFGINKQIKSLFGKTVSMPSSAYLVIEHTEALHVIDVNSGLKARSGDNQESNALQVNIDAAKEIARQLRLRDMGGIIVVDFIDMHSMASKKVLFDKIKEEMGRDRAKHKILPPSRFGLVQITRQRVRPEIKIVTSEKCPACDGTGEVKASVLLIDEIENNIRYFLKEQNEPYLLLRVHPFVEAFLTKGLISIEKKWWIKFKKRIKIKAISSYHLIEYHFFNASDEEIKI